MPKYRDELDRLAERVQKHLNRTIKSYERAKKFSKLFEKDRVNITELVTEFNKLIGTTISLAVSSAQLSLEIKKEVDKLRMK